MPPCSSASLRTAALLLVSSVSSCLGLKTPLSAATPTSANCTTLYFDQRVDHFSWRVPPVSGNLSYAQRYLVCEEFIKPAPRAIFFYVGNEGDVTLYANATGLMWENAAEFSALLLFAEHRDYGVSATQPGATTLEYLSSTQALADYAALLRALQAQYAPSPASPLPVISFGGSYGGVLSALFRAKYPGSVDGAIAASAPLRAFPGQDWDSAEYYAVVSRTMSAAGGASDACRHNIRALWTPLFADGETPAGRATLSTAFSACAPLATPDDVLGLAFWIRGQFDVRGGCSFLCTGG